jgi:NADPH-dependent glutamate synthase beta subunit-like oxidoreductase
LGYRVKIYEKAPKPGGNLTGVIPDYRLSPEVVMDEIAWIESWGIEIQTDTEVGKDLSIAQLFAESHAILLATGAGKSLPLRVAGEESFNVHLALTFLKAVKEKRPPELGNKVVVIGGGNSAVDAAQTAKRLGAEDVRIVCLERQGEMPAYPWQVKQALEEGVVLEVGWGPSSFDLKEDGALSVTCDRCISIWEDGKFSPVLDGDTQKRFYADSFIVAVGGRPDREFLMTLGLISSSEAEQSFDPLTLQTRIKGLFAAGDVTTGPTSVVEAMASGRRAAISIDRYLRGEDLRYGRRDVGPYLFDFPVDLQKANKAPRQPIPELPSAERLGFKEIELTMDEDTARREAGRCLSCGLPVAYFDACWYCLPCEVSCPEEALRVEIPYIIR